MRHLEVVPRRRIEHRGVVLEDMDVDAVILRRYTFLDRADEVINVDVTIEELRNRLREGKIYRPERVEQALSNFFRKGNPSPLRELALRAVADEVAQKAASYRAREGLEPALIPERVMVCMSSNASAPRVIRTGARIAGPRPPAPCSRTSGWQRPWEPPWCASRPTGRRMDSSPSPSARV